MSKLRNGNKGDSNSGSLDFESGILPLSYWEEFVFQRIESGQCDGQWKW